MKKLVVAVLACGVLTLCAACGPAANRDVHTHPHPTPTSGAPGLRGHLPHFTVRPPH
ncbi:hypothetical protein [Nocardia sp. BMG111209]|uniref:hypothetical protein n=1 Tax=Nocardia sp. BMG111209 TaxID=1160137 RepID=UPI00035C41DD|nr:hypothetical protein [Nocardia sp. BMG111209]